MKRLAVALCLLAAPAYAADAPAPQIKPTDQFTITLPAAAWDADIKSLLDSRNLSARDANDLANAIRQQIMAKAQPQKK